MSGESDARPKRTGNDGAAFAVGMLAMILSVPGLLCGMVYPQYSWPLGGIAALFGLIAVMLGAGKNRSDQARSGKTMGFLSLIIVLGGCGGWWWLFGRLP